MKEIKLNLEIKNLKEFKQLIEKAKVESVQLQRTIEQIQDFKFQSDIKN